MWLPSSVEFKVYLNHKMSRSRKYLVSFGYFRLKNRNFQNWSPGPLGWPEGREGNFDFSTENVPNWPSFFFCLFKKRLQKVAQMTSQVEGACSMPPLLEIQYFGHFCVFLWGLGGFHQFYSTIFDFYSIVKVSTVFLTLCHISIGIHLEMHQHPTTICILVITSCYWHENAFLHSLRLSIS